MLSRPRRSSTPIWWSAATALVVLVGALSFIAVRNLGAESPAGAEPRDPPPPIDATVPPDDEVHGPDIYGGVGQEHPPGPDVTPEPGATPDTTKSWWYVPYLNAERGKPVSVQTINGITFGPGLEFHTDCAGPLVVGHVDDVADAKMRIDKAVFPSSALFAEDLALSCQGETVRTELQLTVPAEPKAGFRGGFVLVARGRGAPVTDAHIPDERWYGAVIAGHPAVVARPILPREGLGESEVLIYADGVLTVVYADNLPLQVVLDIAEAQFR